VLLCCVIRQRARRLGFGSGHGAVGGAASLAFAGVFAIAALPLAGVLTFAGMLWLLRIRIGSGSGKSTGNDGVGAGYGLSLDMSCTAQKAGDSSGETHRFH